MHNRENHVNAIIRALHLARKHFDDGGDARAGDSVGGLKGDTGGYSLSLIHISEPTRPY